MDRIIDAKLYKGILRPGVTWFVTNYITLDRVIDKKIQLYQIFVSP